MRRVAPLSIVLLAAASAHAEPAAIQIGNHGNYGRLVIPLNGSATATVVQHRGQIDITVPGVTIATPPKIPRNVVSFTGGSGSATIRIESGAQLKPVQTGHLLILDILDPRLRRRSSHDTAQVRPNPAWSVSTQKFATSSAPHQPTKSVATAKPLAGPAIRPSEAANQSIQSPSVASAAVSNPASSPPDPLHIPAAPEIGAVAFRRGNLGIVVFDDKVEPEPSADGEHPPHATVQHMQGGTMLTVPLAEGQSLALTRDEDGWIIKVGAGNTTVAIENSVPEGIAFQFGKPGRAMTISDPTTGQTLLLGTLRQAGPDRARIDARRSAPGYVLLPTWLGLALEVTSDAVDLSTSQAGFTLQIPDRSAPGRAIAAAPVNPFGIPSGPADVLMRRMDAQIASAAISPPRSRGRERVAAAKTMLALGMAAEAQALLNLAANDDPIIANDPTDAALSGIAAILAQRPGEAAGLDAHNLPANGDVALWRGLRDVEQGKPPANLGSYWPALAHYPEAIRKRIGPDIVEAAVSAGDAVPPSELQGPAFAFARALQKEKAGQIEPALAAFDRTEQRRDERDSVRAAVAAAELRLSRGKITPSAAADQIEQQTVRWRGDDQELAMRLQLAELRTRAGQWRPALEGLRETGVLFPAANQRIAALKAEVFTALLAAKDDTLNPLEIVTIAGEFADCIPQGQEGNRLAGLLAEKLAALDLPSQAIPVLQHLIDQTDSPTTKAEFALRLAKLQLDAGDPAKAEIVLTAIDPDLLLPASADQRLLLLASARAGRGDPAGAAALLSTATTPASEEMRAAFLAKAGDWVGSLQALQQAAATLIPEQGELTEPQQDLLLRQATAAVQAGDAAAIRDLQRFDARMKPPRADLFRMLTASAVESPDDLPRAARELAMSRALPARLDSLKLR